MGIEAFPPSENRTEEQVETPAPEDAEGAFPLTDEEVQSVESLYEQMMERQADAAVEQTESSVPGEAPVPSEQQEGVHETVLERIRSGYSQKPICAT